MLRSELRAGFTQVTSEVRQSNEKLDKVITELAQFKTEVTEFKKDTSTKLDGIGTYLKSINGNILDHSERIFKLERRVDDIDKRLGA